jgi:alkylhydroperoxidase/carboxymuconolactone decarboxylase family protein YurZ
MVVVQENDWYGFVVYTLEGRQSDDKRHDEKPKPPEEMMTDRDSDRNADVEAAELPPTANHVAKEHPELWQAYQQLGAASGAAGPLDDRARRLVHLSMAMAAGSEGATHSHARRAMEEGFTADELDHVALLAITTLGWPQAIRGLSWVRDITGGSK